MVVLPCVPSSAYASGGSRRLIPKRPAAVSVHARPSFITSPPSLLEGATRGAPVSPYDFIKVMVIFAPRNPQSLGSDADRCQLPPTLPTLMPRRTIAPSRPNHQEVTMLVTVIYGERPSSVAGAAVDGDNLWLSLDALRTATGWELKPQGACLADMCVPIPSGHEGEFVRAEGKQFNLAALAHLLNQPVVHDDTHNVWFFGEAASMRSTALLSLQAPDFTLPDLDGRLHSLSDHRGMKVFLVSWASW